MTDEKLIFALRKCWEPHPELQLAADRIEALTAEIEELRGLAEELADDLEVELQARWGFDERLAHKLKRDMEIVERARAALEKQP